MLISRAPFEIRPIDLARFEKKIRPRSGDQCWGWVGAQGNQGYGQIRIQQVLWRAPRLMYELVFGPIPEKTFVCHRCDNPTCTNPKHLFLGTTKDNLEDCARKGRTGGAAKRRLTTEQVYKVRQRLGSGETAYALAKEYGVTATSLNKIRRGETWKWLQ